MNEKEILRLIVGCYVQVKVELPELSAEATAIKNDIETKFQNFKNWANQKTNEL